MRDGTGLVLLCLAGVALVATVPDAGVADGQVQSSAAAAPNATTEGTKFVNATDAGVRGAVSIEGTGVTGTASVEYRRQSSDGDWARTRPEEFTTGDADRDDGTFLWMVTGLQPATTYEYRVRAVTPNGTDRGAVRTFTTEGSAGGKTPTRTRTPGPCPSFRGPGPSLCTRTPTPPTSPSPDDDGTTTAVLDEVVKPSGEPGSDWGLDDWLGGLAPLLAWGAAVVVVAPAVLGGLLWFDSVRRRGSG